MTEPRPSGDRRTPLRVAAEHSETFAAVRTLEGRTSATVRTLEEAADHSMAARVHRRLATVVGSSRLAGWFHSRPDADAAVLDLRQTHTVGWALPPTARVSDELQRRWRTTRSKLRPGVTAPLIEGVRRSRLAGAVARYFRPPSSTRYGDHTTGRNRK